MALPNMSSKCSRKSNSPYFRKTRNFGAVVTDGDFAQSKGTVTLRGIAIVVIGLVLLVTGVALSQNVPVVVVISILGFFSEVAGGMWMLARWW